MALHANALLLLDEARSALSLKAQTSDSDLERLINALTETFESEAGRPFKQRTLTDYRIDGNGRWEIQLPLSPVQSVSKVEIRYDADDSVYKTITDTSKFILKDKESGLLRLKDEIFICGKRNILVTMSVGYVDGDMKLDAAKELLLMQLKFSYRLSQASEVGITSRSYADGSVSFFPSSRLLREVQDGLAKLRDWRFA